MDDMRLKMYSPVTTGIPRSTFPAPLAKPAADKDGPKTGSFQDLLQKQLQQSEGVNFSKHAVKRALEKNIEITEASLERLNQGMRLAEEKNLNDTLILVDRTAFVVSVKNNTVITAVDSNEVKGNVFTNIDGTVII